MDTKNGVPVSPGIVIARCCLIEVEDFRIQRRMIQSDEIEDEVLRLEKSFEKAAEQLVELSRRHANKDNCVLDIFASHIRFMQDRSLIERVSNKVRSESCCAEYAVSSVFREIAATLSSSNDAYIRERVADIYDTEKRLLRILTDKASSNLATISRECIIVAHDLTPTQTASLNLDYTKGFVTNVGGRTSHTAILARSLGIPAIVGLEDITDAVEDGDTIIIDGYSGTVIVRPDEDTIREYHKFSDDYIAKEHKLGTIRDLPAVTKDGVRINLTGNIELPNETKMVVEKGGDGIGLYRTEFLYLQNESEPTEEDHYKAYCDILEKLGGKSLIIRTMDLGADKVYRSERFAEEANPVLGFKSIRFCLASQNIGLFKTQLRAILRASAHGKTKVMFPMITTIDEVRHAKMIVRDVMEDLEDEGLEYDSNIEMGIMIETPSAALISSMLAKEVDFFSVGTNDLIQYTLAVDRANEKLNSYYSAGQPAILKLLLKIVRDAEEANIPVSICGEIASEPEFVPFLVGIGVRSLSVAPPMIPEIKMIIRLLDMDTCRALVDRVLVLDRRRSIMNCLRDTLMIIEQKAD
ncbi:MAG: phosphoenolpyruvate--protein phosphotransferase [Phycisphaerae bacterium]|jgi:phosphotransferase system enzyme I (PtsI)